MKCKLPNQESGTSRLYLEDAMEEFYDAPGKKVWQENGVKYLEVREEVGQSLIENYGFEEYDESSGEDDTKETE